MRASVVDPYDDAKSAKGWVPALCSRRRDSVTARRLRPEERLAVEVHVDQAAHGMHID